MQDIENLDDYLARYGTLLAQQAERALRPLHRPGTDPVVLPKLLRAPFQAQAHVIMAGVKALRRQKSLLVIGEMGTGKTLIGQVMVHAHALQHGRRGYRALVFCPGQLVGKWEREIKETLPGVSVIQIERWTDVAALYRRLYRLVPDGAKGRCVRRWPAVVRPTWYVIARDRAKLGARWGPAFLRRPGDEALRCPDCFARLVKEDKSGQTDEGETDGLLLTVADLTKKRTRCAVCHSPCYTVTNQLRRFEPAKYVHKKLPGFFDYLLLDEAHEEKSAESAQANAIGALAAASRRTLALTGTLIGGYAEHVRPLLLRLSPTSLVREGFGWSSVLAFSEKYGRIETCVREKSGTGSGDNKQSRGSMSRTKVCRPGIMPTLFGRHLMGNAVFLGLDEVAANLPELREEVRGVEMDPEVAHAYRDVAEKLEDAIRDMVRTGDRRLLGAMLQTLLGYPDHPFGWQPVGYRDERVGKFIEVVQPSNLDPTVRRPKEAELLQLVQERAAQAKQCWVYTTMTGERDVADRLYRMFRAAGLRANVLRSSVPLATREEWIAKNGPKADVIVSHPKLVETGLDLFDKGGGHNFSVLIFYQTGYNLFTLRQAARRAWRIGQRLPCEVHYLYYERTMQARAMELMGKKLQAAQAIEGKFSTDGLVAMSGDEGIEMALARSLASRIEDLSPARTWAKIGSEESPDRLNVADFQTEMAKLVEANAWLFKEMEGLDPQACGFQEAA